MHISALWGSVFLFIYSLLTTVTTVFHIAALGGGGSAHFLIYQLLTIINVVLHTSTLGGFAQLVAADCNW